MILISVAIDINTKKKINNKGNKKMKHVIFAHSHCTDGLYAVEPETSYCISSKISVKNILLKKLNLIKSAFNDRYEIEF